MPERCEGWRRTGGAFTLGPVRWDQCENDGYVLLEVDGKKMPACAECWKECRDKGVVIQSVSPIPEVPHA